jgi:CRP/FNR family transcriptional regulator
MPYEAWGYAEGALEALALPPEAFRALLAENAAFREAAFGVFSRRLAALVEVIDELLARRPDLRLARWLSERAGAPVEATHQAIAAELATAREVVSRALKDFERRGWVALARGSVTVRQAAALAAHARG